MRNRIGPAKQHDGRLPRTLRFWTAVATSLALIGPLALATAPTATAATTPTATWSQLTGTPPGRAMAAMAYDSGTGQLVLFGGLVAPYAERSGSGLSDTWIWDGGTWRQAHPAAGPLGVFGAAMAYDRATNQLLLLGGTSGGVEPEPGGTWAWDGSSWSRLHPAISPPPAYGQASMAYDAASRQLVYLGNTGDTWTWDGSTWSRLAVGGPTARYNTSMAFDSGTGQLVLFGGIGVAGSRAIGDTWLWDGSTWSEAHPHTNPPARSNASMGSDTATGQTLLFGGLGIDRNGEFPLLRDTWSWDGATWAQIQVATLPSERAEASMAYDDRNGQLVLFGGIRNSAPCCDTQTVQLMWNGTAWTPPSITPPARLRSAMAYDGATSRVTLFGGTPSLLASDPLGDTWTWDGQVWRQAHPAASPPARQAASMAYDQATGQLVLYGGISAGGVYLDDTWTWDGTTWTQMHPAVAPPPRFGAGSAYDPATGQLILFGGWGSGHSSYLGDTWTWDGTTWTQMHPATSPPARFRATMAYDPGAAQLILFGGASGDYPGGLNDTWTWSGATWTAIHPTFRPPVRYSAAMAYDPLTFQLVVAGGFSTSRGRLEDTWTWNGITWTQGPGLPAISAASMAFDEANDQLILFGGYREAVNSIAGGVLSDTWSYGLL